MGTRATRPGTRLTSDGLWCGGAEDGICRWHGVHYSSISYKGDTRRDKRRHKTRHARRHTPPRAIERAQQTHVIPQNCIGKSPKGAFVVNVDAQPRSTVLQQLPQRRPERHTVLVRECMASRPGQAHVQPARTAAKKRRMQHAAGSSHPAPDRSDPRIWRKDCQQYRGHGHGPRHRMSAHDLFPQGGAREWSWRQHKARGGWL
jgi:hypothetical protein